jgi:hypothetical protein
MPDTDNLVTVAMTGTAGDDRGQILREIFKSAQLPQQDDVIERVRKVGDPMQPVYGTLALGNAGQVAAFVEAAERFDGVLAEPVIAPQENRVRILVDGESRAAREKYLRNLFTAASLPAPEVLIAQMNEKDSDGPGTTVATVAMADADEAGKLITSAKDQPKLVVKPSGRKIPQRL